MYYEDFLDETPEEDETKYSRFEWDDHCDEDEDE
jgi:hypothetical protein